MAMSRECILRRLHDAKVVNCIYRRGESTGLILAWANAGQFVLTWEECPAGQQYDESTCTRDERYEFASAEEVLVFVEQSGYSASAFGP